MTLLCQNDMEGVCGRKYVGMGVNRKKENNREIPTVKCLVVSMRRKI